MRKVTIAVCCLGMSITIIGCSSNKREDVYDILKSKMNDEAAIVNDDIDTNSEINTNLPTNASDWEVKKTDEISESKYKRIEEDYGIYEGESDKLEKRTETIFVNDVPVEAYSESYSNNMKTYTTYENGVKKYVSSESYDNSGNLIRTFDEKYNEHGDNVELVSSDINTGETETRTYEYSYDERGNRISEHQFVEGELVFSFENEYDEQDRRILFREYDKSGILIEEISNKYIDETKEIMTITKYDSEGNIVDVSETELTHVKDENGNMIHESSNSNLASQKLEFGEDGKVCKNNIYDSQRNIIGYTLFWDEPIN